MGTELGVVRVCEIADGRLARVVRTLPAEVVGLEQRMQREPVGRPDFEVVVGGGGRVREGPTHLG